MPSLLKARQDQTTPEGPPQPTQDFAGLSDSLASTSETSNATSTNFPGPEVTTSASVDPISSLSSASESFSSPSSSLSESSSFLSSSETSSVSAEPTSSSSSSSSSLSSSPFVEFISSVESSSSSSEFPSSTSDLETTTASTSVTVLFTSEPAQVTTLRTANDQPLPTTTLLAPSQSDPTSDSTIPTNVGATASDNGFWANKSAVAGTFSVVAIVIVASLVGLCAFVIRRRRRSSNPLVFNDKHSEPELLPDPIRVDSASPSSSTDLNHRSPMDVFGGHDMYYANYDTSFYDAATTDSSHHASTQDHVHPSFSNTQTNVYLPPPPSIMLSLAAESSRVQADPFRDPPRPGDNSPHPSLVNIHTNVYDSNVTAERQSPSKPLQNPFSPPATPDPYSNALNTPTLNASSAERESYQHSIDSFYGGAYAK